MNKKTLIAAALGALMIAPLANAGPLTIEIDNIRTQTGTIRLGVFDEAGYKSDEAVNGANITVDGAKVSVTIDGLAPGAYGIKLYHDVDDNGAMNTNPFGMPTEPFAFSNNAAARFGPASWANAKFDVTEEGAVQTINLN